MKKYSKSHLLKAVSLGTAMAALLSSVSPVLAANLAIVGGVSQSTGGTAVLYPRGSHGSIVFAGDDDHCGVNNVEGRGGDQQKSLPKITAVEQYENFINNQEDKLGRNPYGTTTSQVTWVREGVLSNNASYMGAATTGGTVSAMPEAFGVYSFVTGCGAAATGNYSTAFGAGATTKAGGAQAFGVAALASGTASVAMGVSSEASGESTIAIGGLANASGKNSVALGREVKAQKDSAIAIGMGAEARGFSSIAIGSRFSDRSQEGTDEDVNGDVIAQEENTIAIGTHAFAEKVDAIAIGANAHALARDSVAIGGGSIADREKGTVGYDPATGKETTKTDIVWKSTGGAFSIGEVGGDHNGTLTRQITGVAAGTEDTDAVNVAQLKALRSIVGEGGGSWQISANGGEATEVNAGNTVDFSVTNSGEGKDNLKIAKNTADGKHKIQFTLDDNLKLTSVTTGKSKMSDDGFTINENGPRMTIDGIDAGNKKITGVDDGEEETDAVNFGQLQKYVKENGGGWKLSVEEGEPTDVNPGNTVHFFAATNNGTGHKNIKIANTDGKNISFDLSENIKVTSITTGNSIMDASGFGFIDGNGPKIALSGIDAGSKKITKVADGAVDTDAVNYKQLTEVRTLAENGWKLSVDGNNATDVKAGSTVDLVAAESKYRNKNIILKKDNNQVKFDLNDKLKLTSVTTGNSIMDENGFGFVDNGPKITVEGIDAGNKKIEGVAKGTDDTDAVNYGQLKEIKNEIVGNSLVKWEEGQKLITIGADKDGIEINVANNKNKQRIISGVAVGKVSSDSTEAINGHQLFNYADNISKYFGGETDVIDGFKPTFTIQKKEHHNVTDAFKDVDSSITDIYSQINNVTSNSLVKWDEDQKLITIGAEKDGTKIDIANKSGDARKISGVKDGGLYEDSTEAVNGSQLWDTNQKVAHIDTKVTAISNTIADMGEQIHGISQDALLWSEEDGAFVARHGEGDNKTNSKITFLKNGDISEDSTDAINGSQINKISKDIAQFFGGDTSFENGVFTGPRYNLSDVGVDGTIKQKEHNDVGSALTGLDTNIKNVNQNLINSMNDIATYFGGGAGYDKNGEWHAPTFQVYHIDNNGTVSKKPYDNVADAFEGVNNTFTNIHNQISDIKENNLVQQEEEDGPITIGAKTGGDVINIANNKDRARTISGIKDGNLSQDSTEAVNGSQLFKIAQNTSKYFGGSTDVIEGIKPTFVIGGNSYDNVTEAFTGVDVSIYRIDNKISNLEKNNLVQQEGGASGIITIGKNTAGTEINIAGYGGSGRKISGVREAEKGDEAVNKDQLDKSIEKISKDIETASAAAVLYDKNEDGTINYGSVTLGGDKNNGPVALRNVKDGRIAENSHDAINGSQLYSISNQLAAYFGGGAKYENGKWTAPQFKIVQVNADGTTVEKSHNNVADAFDGIKNNMSNINNRIDDVINKVDSDALKWNKEKGAYDATHDGTPSKIINVADGKIAEGSKDAVNGGQLWQTNERVAEVENRVTDVENHVEIIDKKVNNISNMIGDIGDTVNNINIKVDKMDDKVNNIAEDAVRYDRDANGKKTNKITLKGSDPSEPVMIDNVADGRIEKGSKEAVNGGQLHDYTKEQMKIVLDESKKYTDQRVNNIVIDAIDDAVDKSKQYTDMKFNALNYSIEGVRKEARQAAAIGLAVANLRYNDTPGKLSVGFGSGLWRSQSAFAFGAGYTSEKGNIRSNVSVTTSGGHWGVGAGFNMTLN